MKFNIRFSLSGIPVYDHNEGGVKSAFAESDVLQMLFVKRGSVGKKFLALRSGELFELDNFDAEKNEIDILYDDFKVAVIPEYPPLWYPLLLERIISTEGIEEYGSGQGIQVKENINFGTAFARVRNVQARYGNSGQFVFCVKIKSSGKESFLDSLKLHARILSGEAYS